MKIQQHLTQETGPLKSFANEIAFYLNTKWSARLNDQLTGLHWAAYYLHSETHHESYKEQNEAIYRAIQQHAGEQAVLDFYCFRGRTEAFHDGAICWQQPNMEAFWRVMV